MKKLIYLFLGMLLFPLLFYGQDFEHSYALIIGIDRYKDQQHWKKLEYAVKDATAMGHYLAHHGYEVVYLYDGDATKEKIIENLQNALAPKIKSNDRILFFFAGHGYTEELGGKDRGYIVPFDGGERSASYISMDEIMTQSSYMSTARHQLFIMDSCYSGLLAMRGSKIDSSSPDYIRELAKRYARQVITAGGKDQEVQDGGPNGHSVFMDALLEGLVQGLADPNHTGYVTASGLAHYLELRASNAYQTPAAGTLPGHGGGEYLFKLDNYRSSKGSVNKDQTPQAFKRGSRGPNSKTAEPTISESTKSRNDTISTNNGDQSSHSAVNDGHLMSQEDIPPLTAMPADHLSPYQHNAISMGLEDPYSAAARARYHEGKYEDALANINHVIGPNSDVRLYNNRGVLYADLKQYKNAIADFRRAGAGMNLAKVYFDTGDYRTALQIMNQLIVQDPTNYVGLYWRSVVEKKLGDSTNASADLKLAHQLGGSLINISTISDPGFIWVD